MVEVKTLFSFKHVMKWICQWYRLIKHGKDAMYSSQKQNVFYFAESYLSECWNVFSTVTLNTVHLQTLDIFRSFVDNDLQTWHGRFLPWYRHITCVQITKLRRYGFVPTVQSVHSYFVVHCHKVLTSGIDFTLNFCNLAVERYILLQMKRWLVLISWSKSSDYQIVVVVYMCIT